MESGVLLGDDQEWDVGVRAALGTDSKSASGVSFGLVAEVGRAFQ